MRGSSDRIALITCPTCGEDGILVRHETGEGAAYVVTHHAAAAHAYCPLPECPHPAETLRYVRFRADGVVCHCRCDAVVLLTRDGGVRVLDPAQRWQRVDDLGYVNGSVSHTASTLGAAPTPAYSPREIAGGSL